MHTYHIENINCTLNIKHTTVTNIIINITLSSKTATNRMIQFDTMNNEYTAK